MSKLNLSLFSGSLPSKMSEAAPQSFKVFKVKDKLAMQDPEETETRYHTVIFVQTSSDGSGWIHHVAGDITIGMKYE